MNNIFTTLLIYRIVQPQLLGKWPNLQRSEVFLNTRFAHYFFMDLFLSNQILIIDPLSGMIPRSAHLK
jgi:hypothetical protein